MKRAVARLVWLLPWAAGWMPAARSMPAHDMPAPEMRAPGAVEEARRITVRGVTVELRGVGDSATVEASRVVEDQLALAGDSRVSPPLADDLAYFLRGRYLQLGHAQAVVDWSIHDGIVRLDVQEGRRWEVGEIRIQGAEGVPSDELENFLLRPTREREGRRAPVWRGRGRTLPFVEADLRAGADLVVRHLQSLGFLEATSVPPVFVASANEGTMDVELTLTPGIRSVFGVVDFTGDTSTIDDGAKDRARALETQPFSEVTLESTRTMLKGALQGAGYFAADVGAAAGAGVSEPGAATRVPVVFTVMPGKRYAVRAVQVDEGLGRGATRVARAIFSAATAQTYAPDSIDLLHRRALDSGLFSRLDVEPVAAGEAELDLRIRGEEAKPKTLGFYGGYESLLGPIIGLEARHVNFLDSGDAVALRGEFRGAGGEASVQWTDPAVFGSRWSLGTSLSWETFTFRDYDRQTAAWRSALTRRFTRRIAGDLFTTLSINDMDTDVLTPEELGPDEFVTATGGARLTFDYRDHPLLARKGWLLELAAEGGWIDGGDGDDVTFARGEIGAAWHHPLGERWRFSLGARSRVLLTASEVAEVPIDLRVFNGGANSVRSFAERELGPMSTKGDTPLGGLASHVASAEISWEAVRNLELAAFADAGSLGEDASTFIDLDDLRYGLGLGLRYRLPVGPLRIDYGINPDRRDGEAFGAFHVTFGFAF